MCPRINQAAFGYYERLARVKEYVYEDLARSPTLREAATVARMEMHYFCSFFRDKTGVTFTTWMDHVRVQGAVSLLASKNYTISQVAEEVGYRSIRTFQRAFKRHTGMSPSAFKKEIRPS